MDKIVALPEGIILAILIPGLINVWVRKGFYGKQNFLLCFFDIVISGILIFSTTLLFSFIIYPFLVPNAFYNLMTGVLILFLQGFTKIPEKGSSVTMAVLILLCAMNCIAMIHGIGYKYYLAGKSVFLRNKKNKHPKIIPNSFLDHELLKLREKDIIPEIRIFFKSNEVIKGRCYSYTYTEPREIAVNIENIENDSKKEHIVLVKINDDVSRIELIYNQKEQLPAE